MLKKGTVKVKAGSRIVELSDISEDLIQRKMEEVLEKHKHICGSCDSEACKGNLNIENDIVVRGIETHDRQYIFDCLAYHQRRLQGGREYNEAEYAKKYSMLFHSSLPGNSANEMDSAGALLDAYDARVDEQLAAGEELENLYGPLLAEMDQPVVYYKTRRKH